MTLEMTRGDEIKAIGASMAQDVRRAFVNAAPGPILVVEDDDVARRLIGDALRHAKVENAIEYADCVEAALRRLADDERPVPHLIVADLTLRTRHDGLGLISAVRGDEKLRAVPLVVLSGDVDPDVVARSLDLGADEYIVKPLLPADFNAVVERLGLKRCVIGKRESE